MILDTNAVSAVLEGDDAIQLLLGKLDQRHLPIIVIGEYQFGIKSSRRRRLFEIGLRRLESDSHILYVDRSTADFYAAIRFELKKIGRPIPENDTWIAAMALQHQLSIISRDTHFDVVPGVQRIGW